MVFTLNFFQFFVNESDCAHTCVQTPLLLQLFCLTTQYSEMSTYTTKRTQSIHTITSLKIQQRFLFLVHVHWTLLPITAILKLCFSCWRGPKVKCRQSNTPPSYLRFAIDLLPQTNDKLNSFSQRTTGQIIKLLCFEITHNTHSNC